METFWTLLTWLACFSPLIFASEEFRKSLIIVKREANNFRNNVVKETDTVVIEPKIYKMQIDTNITNRYARTLITSKVQNLDTASREVMFSVILPDKAFISDFIMVIRNESYKAYVKEKQEAKGIYNKAVASGVGAGYVEASARESNRFTVTVNVESTSKATFLLTYEELLMRKESTYELVTNIHPNQLVTDLSVNVVIDESQPLKFVRTAPFRSGNEITKGTGDLDPRPLLRFINSSTAIVTIKPSIERQAELAANLKTDVKAGLSGQFVVQYDVERHPNGGEVLFQDGYFVHFFAPSDIKPLNKYIIFALDTSGSMYSQKMLQLKEAMYTILDQLDDNDRFHIVNFESSVKVWNIRNHLASINVLRKEKPSGKLSVIDLDFPSADLGTPENLQRAKKVIRELEATGGTNIYDALQVALTLVEREKRNGVYYNNTQSMIMFLTDGEPTVGISSTDVILTDITKMNTHETPIYSLSFGEDADKNFLKKLALKNRGFLRHIYEASDAALQLQNFYKEIALPLLKDIKFQYLSKVTDLTKSQYPVYFNGSEIVVSGKTGSSISSETMAVMCTSAVGSLALQPIIERPVTSLERLWAYLTVQQLLEERDVAQNKNASEKKALDLALKYSFVTSVTSLVVVRPNSTNSSVNPEGADKAQRHVFTPYDDTGVFMSDSGETQIKFLKGISSVYGCVLTMSVTISTTIILNKYL